MELRDEMEMGSEFQAPAVQAQAPALVEAEKARAVQEVQAALVIAKRFPRDEVAAETRIMNACRRYSLAKVASYAYPRGKEKVSGPSIRMAEMLAQNWGNLQYGFKELEQGDGKSTVEAFCWDMETNSKQSRVFTVHHKIKAGGGMKTLTDPRDIYELVANNAQRRVRAAILGVIPGDIVERAVLTCRKTLAAGEKAEPLIDRVKRMCVAFQELGVSKELIEKRLGHAIEATTPDEIADLQEIYNAVKGGESRREDWFDLKSPTGGGKAAELNERFSDKKPAATAEKKQPEPEYDPNFDQDEDAK